MNLSDYPKHIVREEWEAASPVVELRQGIREILGIQPEILEDLQNKLEEASLAEPFELSPGARLLQGFIQQTTPYAGLPHFARRLRGICTFIAALEHVAKSLQEDTSDSSTEESNGTDRPVRASGSRQVNRR